jgi:hypothetical protein
VSVTVPTDLVLTTAKTLKLELSDANKGKGINSICYIQNDPESVTLTADKAANSSIGDSETINFTVTSSYGSSVAGTKVAGIKVSNLESNEYTLTATSGVLGSSGTFTFGLTAVALRTATLDKTFNVSLLYNEKDTLTSSTYNLSKSIEPTLSTKFRDSTNTLDLTVINPTNSSGAASSAKLLISQTALPSTENVTITITPSPTPSVGYVFSGNENTFSKTMTVAELTAASNLVDVVFTLAVPSNITLTAEVKAAVRNGLSATNTLLLNNAARAFTITKDYATIGIGATKNYNISIANENTLRNVTWSIAFADSSDISTYFSTHSGTGSISVGGSLTASITRNSVGYPIDKAIVLTVTDAGGVVPTNTNSEMMMVPVGVPTPVIKFYDTTGTEIPSFLTLPDSTIPYMVKAEIYSGDFTSGDLVSYKIECESKTLDLFTTSDGAKVADYSISIVNNAVDSNKKVSTTFWVKKNTKTIQAGNDIALTLSSAKVSNVIKQLTTKQSLNVKTKSIVLDALSIYRNGYKAEQEFNIIIGGDYDIFVDKTAVINTSTDKVYFVINPLVGNVSTLTGSNFTITPNGGSAVTVTSHTTTNAALNAVIPTTGLLYDVTAYANDRVNFKVNTGSITANDKVSLTCYIIRANDLGYLASSLVTATIAAAPIKSYTPTLRMSVYNGGTGTMEYTPVNFATGDTHTLTLPLHDVTLASDVNIWVNDTAITAISSSGVLTPSISLTGNNKVRIKVTSKSDKVGFVESKIVNVADSTIKSTTILDTNTGIVITADKDVYETQAWEVKIAPRITDVTYQVGVFDYSTGSYVGIQGSGNVHISYTDINGTTIIEDLSSRLITFNSSNLGADNVATFKYFIPNGFNSSPTIPKKCRIKFVGSDGSVAFFPIGVSQNAEFKKTFVITNDSSSANNAKKEGDIVTFTITPKNVVATDLYNFTLKAKNNRGFSLIEGDKVVSESLFFGISVKGKNLLTDNTIKIRLDDNLVVDQTTEIVLTVTPIDTAYITNGSVNTSSAFVVNSSTSNQTIKFANINSGEEISRIKNKEYFYVQGYNNVTPRSISFPSDLVQYVESSISNVVSVDTSVAGVITYAASAPYYRFKFKALQKNVDDVITATFSLNKPANTNTPLTAKIGVVEEKFIGAINVTTNDNLLYANSKTIVFHVDTKGFNSNDSLNWTLTPSTGMFVDNVTFVDLNTPEASRKKWIEGTTDTSDGLMIYPQNIWSDLNAEGKEIPNTKFMIKYNLKFRSYVNNFQEAKDYVDKLNNQELAISDWYNDWIIPDKRLMRILSGYTVGPLIVLENIPSSWYFDDTGLYHSYKKDGQVNPNLGTDSKLSVFPIRKMYI